MSDVRGFYLAEILLFVLSAADSAFTHLWLVQGVATEANPLLAAAWGFSPLTFHTLKGALLLGSASILHHYRAVPAAQLVMGLSTMAYASVVAWHVVHL
jgi:hypothetical protein